MRGIHKENTKRELLPEDFVPTESDVVCGRGRTIDQHAGNRRFRKIIKQHEHRYVSAERKLDKTTVISNILLLMKNGPEPCRFVDKDDETGRWYEISTLMAKDKVAQAMRTCVRSSMGILNITKKEKALQRKQMKQGLRLQREQAAKNRHKILARPQQVMSGTSINLEAQNQEILRHAIKPPIPSVPPSSLADIIKTEQATNLLSAAMKPTAVLPYLVAPVVPVQGQSNLVLPCLDLIAKEQQRQQINQNLQLKNEIEQLKREKEELLTSIISANAIQQQQQERKREMQRRLLLKQRTELLSAFAVAGRNEPSILMTRPPPFGGGGYYI